MQSGKLNLLLDLSFGSSGKGNVAAYIGSKNELDLTIANHSPNAGHSIIYKNETQVVKMIPTSGIYCKGSNILLGSGTVVDLDILKKEIKQYDLSERILVSATAPVVNEYCKEYEREHLQYIASTFQGTGAAIGLKAMRSDKIKLVKDYPELKKYCHSHIGDIILNRIDKHGYTGLCEIPQGYGLSVDSELYPFVTSRIVNVAQALAYLDIPVGVVGDVIGVTRTYPIRVGNVPTGYSGDTFFDSNEVTWEQLSNKLGKQVLEMTSVTKRVRRVFTFSKYLFRMAVRRNGINVLFLTFVDYLLPDEKQEFIDFLTSAEFNFKEIYFVSGFWDWDKNIECIK